MSETLIAPRSASSRAREAKAPRGLGGIKSEVGRLKTGIFEFDRVFGGGIVPGSINLVAGDPGIGKSTLLLQVAGALSSQEAGSVLYVCGEESPEQIKSRAERLKVTGQNLDLLPETDIDMIGGRLSASAALRRDGSATGYQLVIVDSIQTLTTGDLAGGAGSIGQVRECAERLRRMAKDSKTAIILVGHVTKAGGIAGPKVLEHIVDGVFSLEGDRFHSFRILRASKNRFGPTFEVGIFAMGAKGLRAVENPSSLFLSERNAESSGSVVVATLEGTRPVLVEIQALAVPSRFKYPHRATSGFSARRLDLLCAVLEKRVGFDLQGKDLYVNVASGMRVAEPAADLGVVLALASVTKGRPLGSKVCVFGEVGLSGEVRSVSDQERRVSESARLGFSEVICPPKIKTVSQALSAAGIS